MKNYYFTFLFVAFLFVVQSTNAQFEQKNVDYKLNKSASISQDGPIKGYNIYRNGEKINTELVTELEFQDEVPENGEYTYYVTAVYDEGESGKSNETGALYDSNAAVREYVVAEKGTGVKCPYCPAAANGFRDLENAGKKILGIAYHTRVYSDSDSDYISAATDSRISYYGMTSFPTAVFDGVEVVSGGGTASQSMFDYYAPIVDERIGISTAFALGVSGQVSNTTYTANVTVEKVAINKSKDLRLFAVVVENHIQEYWQGLTEVNDVARKVLPKATGHMLDFTNSNQENVEIEFSVKDSWDVDNCNIVVFVQDYETKEIHQATKIDLVDFAEAKMSKKSANNEDLWVPKNLVAKSLLMSPVVNLRWKNPYWFQWDNGTSSNAIGSGTRPLMFDAAGKWLSSDLQALDGMVISKVSVLLSEESCEYSARIWSGTNAKNVLFDSVYSEVVVGEWNEMVLDEPIKIDVNDELWVGSLNNNTESKFSASCDDGPVVVGKGDKVRFYDNNQPQQWEALSRYGFDSNWNIKFFVEPYEAPVDTTSVIALEKPVLNVYPNPARSNIFIESDVKINQLYLISINGQLVRKQLVNAVKSELSLEGVKTGIYFVKIITDKGYGFEKLIVE